MKKQKIIKINVDCDVAISKEVYVLVIEAMLKYILYQFQQVPVQIDILERDLRKGCTSSDTQENSDCIFSSNGIDEVDENTNPRAFLRQMALKRKAEFAKRSFERKRQRWLSKVQNVIQHFKSTLELLQCEIENSQVVTTMFVIGSSSLTAKYIFKIHVPSNPTSQYYKENDTFSGLPTLKRRILMNLFRAFANSEEMCNFTGSYIAASKLWTLFEKKDMFHKVGESLCQEKIIPRTDFNIHQRAKVVEIFLEEPKLPDCYAVLDMELTPCIHSTTNRGSKHSSSGRGAFKKIDIYSQKNYLMEEDEFNLEPLEDILKTNCTEEDAHDSHSDSCRVSRMSECNNEQFASSFKTPLDKRLNTKFSFTPHLKPHSKNIPKFIDDFWLTPKQSSGGQNTTNTNTPFFKTPHPSTIMGSNSVTTPYPDTPFNGTTQRMIETPVVVHRSTTPSPVKRLAQSMQEIQFTPEKDNKPLEHSTWYQIEYSINGFKDIFLAKN